MPHKSLIKEFLKQFIDSKDVMRFIYEEVSASQQTRFNRFAPIMNIIDSKVAAIHVVTEDPVEQIVRNAKAAALLDLKNEIHNLIKGNDHELVKKIERITKKLLD